MEPFLVKTYRLYWDVKNNIGGAILVLDRAKEVPLEFEQPQVFLAVSSLLRNEGPLFFDPRRGRLQTRSEPVGEGEV